VSLWSWVFALVAISSILGAIAHGLAISEGLRTLLWKPLYLLLGIAVGLFAVGAVNDWRGEAIARRLILWGVAVGLLFFAWTQLKPDNFIVFLIYEGIAMVAALVIYTYVAATHRLKGAGAISIAILFNLIAAALQASDFTIRIIFPFDHNGIFHLVQMAGIMMLGFGIDLGNTSRKR
jgi:hypothetical protein